MTDNLQPKGGLEIMDFDRTTFMTDVFAGDMIDDLVAGKYIDEQQQNELKDSLAQPDSVDITDLLANVGIGLEVLGEVVAEMSGDYVYEDARRYIESNEGGLHIVTTALSVEFQRLKIEQARLGCPYKILKGNKGDFFRKVISNGISGGVTVADPDFPSTEYDGLIITDDKISQLRPLVGAEGVDLRLITRPDSKYRPSADEAVFMKNNGIRSVHSFDSQNSLAA